jgi:hypothetical protein
MMALHEVTLPQDVILTQHSVMATFYRELVQLGTLPFGMMWWPWVGYTAQEAN